MRNEQTGIEKLVQKDGASKVRGLAACTRLVKIHADGPRGVCGIVGETVVFCTLFCFCQDTCAMHRM